MQVCPPAFWTPHIARVWRCPDDRRQVKVTKGNGITQSYISTGQRESDVLKNKSLFRNSTFAADVLKILSGTAIAEILVVLTAPIVTRLYGPEAFGLSALLFALIGIIGVIACLRYEFSIVLPQDDKVAANLFAISLLSVCMIALLTGLITVFGAYTIASMLRTPEIENYLWIVPVGVLFTGFFMALNYWNTRLRHFERLSTARVTNSVTTVGIQLGAGFLGYTFAGSLIGALIFGLMASMTTLAIQTWKESINLFFEAVSLENILSGFKRYIKFPLFDTWSALLNNVSWQLPLFLLAFYFSPVVVGLYSLGFIVLQTPFRLVGAAISQVFLQRASVAAKDGTLGPLTENMVIVLIKLGLLPMLLLSIVGATLFSVFFGEQWAEAGVYAQILSVFIFVNFVSDPLHHLWVVLERQGFGLKFNVVNIITRLFALMLGGILGDARLAILLFAVTGIGTYSYVSYRITLFSGARWKTIIRAILIGIIRFIPAGIFLIALQMTGVNQIVILLATGGILLMYGAYIYTKDPMIRNLPREIGLW